MYIYNGSIDKKAQKTSRTAQIVSAGTVEHIDTDKMTLRENGRADWSLFYCKSGRVFFDNTVITQGQIWLYPPDTAQRYVAYKKDKTVYLFIHFTGNNLASLFEELKIAPQKPILPGADFSDEIIKRIIDVSHFEDPASLLTGEYLLLRLLSFLVPKNERIESHDIGRVTDYMEHSYCQPYSAATFAKMLNISESRFNHLFKSETGLSPKAYYINLRIDNACRMLEATNLKINEISARVGYPDPLHFGQVFKKHKGTSPSRYRKVYR